LESTSGDVVLSVLPLSFGYGLSQLLPTFLVGGTLVVERSFAFPQVTLQRMASERCTGFAMVPTIATILLQNDRLISPPGQPEPLEPRPQVLPIRIEEDELFDAQLFVEQLLLALVLSPGLPRRDLHHQARNRLLPKEIVGAVPFGDALRQQNVRRDDGGRVAPLVAKEEVAPDPDIRHVDIAAIQTVDEVVHHLPMEGRLGHGLAVGGGILDLFLEWKSAHTYLPFPNGLRDQTTKTRSAQLSAPPC
jgi:hypothetical protein